MLTGTVECLVTNTSHKGSPLLNQISKISKVSKSNHYILTLLKATTTTFRAKNLNFSIVNLTSPVSNHVTDDNYQKLDEKVL